MDQLCGGMNTYPPTRAACPKSRRQNNDFAKHSSPPEPLSPESMMMTEEGVPRCLMDIQGPLTLDKGGRVGSWRSAGRMEQFVRIQWHLAAGKQGRVLPSRKELYPVDTDSS